MNTEYYPLGFPQTRYTLCCLAAYTGVIKVSGFFEPPFVTAPHQSKDISQTTNMSIIRFILELSF